MTHQGFNTLSPALQAVALPPLARFRLVSQRVVGFTPNSFEWANTTRRRWHKKMVASGYYAKKAKEWREKKKAERRLTAPLRQQRKSTTRNL